MNIGNDPKWYNQKEIPPPNTEVGKKAGRLERLKYLVNISKLCYVLGCITEVVARHVAHAGFIPEDLYQPVSEDSTAQSVSQSTQDSGSAADNASPGNIKEWIWGNWLLFYIYFNVYSKGYCAVLL